MIVADASLVIAWLLAEPNHTARVEEFDRLLTEPLAVPANWSQEVSNALRKACRTGRLRKEEIAPLAQRLAAFDIEIARPMPITEIDALTKFAMEFDLSAYDASYVRLAIDRQSTLATVDGRMRAAARRLRLPLLPSD